MKDIMPFEGDSEPVSDRLSDQEAESPFHEIAARASEQFHIKVLTSSSCFTKILSSVVVQKDRRRNSPHVNARLLWLGVLDGQVDAQEDAQARMFRQGHMHVHTRLYLSNTTVKSPGIAKKLLGQFREVAELNDEDIVGCDFNTSAHRERGKVKLTSSAEAREEVLLTFSRQVSEQFLR